MRREFAEILLHQMELEPRIYVITADLGYKMWDKIKDRFPGRYVNVGAAEQTMMDIAVGMAYDGKLPVTYTITPFYYRGFETIRTYIDHEKLPVLMVGSGRDTDYAHDGYSHNAEDAEKIFGVFPNIKSAFPETVDEMREDTLLFVKEPKPTFLSLKR